MAAALDAPVEDAVNPPTELGDWDDAVVSRSLPELREKLAERRGRGPQKKVSNLTARSTMQSKSDYYHRQSAVIPFRRGRSGLEVLLITNRKRRRWVVPKGVVEPGLSAADSAAKEAYEEAGIKGRVLPGSLGFYEYEKLGGTYRVEVYAMEVEQELEHWPEAFRERAWVSPVQAAGRVREPELKGLIERLSSTVAWTILR